MSAAQNITRHFKGDWHGTYGSIPAPGHGKTDRGVTVKDADSGGVVFNSFNDADWRKLKDECREAGLLPARERGNGSWRETGSYLYSNEHGEVLYRTRRLERTGARKRFIAERLENGEWKPKLDGVERVLYRLPEIKAAINRAVLKDETLPPIYLVEGERKADKLASWGLLATAVAFGANGWREAYAHSLAACAVVILPDNDQPGREFAAAAAADIVAAGGKAVLVDLPGLGVGEDIINWKGSAEDLGELTAKAMAGEQTPPETFEIADMAMWAVTAPTPKAFYMPPFVPRDDVVIITGDGGTNKSTLALQMCACSAASKQMLGMDVTPGPALYVTAEDDDRENHWRLAKIASAIGTTIDRLVGRLHIVSLRGRLSNELATFDHDGKLRPAPAYALLRATIEKTGAKLVTLDNVAHLFNGNENDRGQVTAFINLLYRLCGDLGVTILLIAHRNKSGDSYSGSTAWLNAVRSQVLIERSDENDADVRRLSLGKANYARQGEQIDFRWHDFALIRNDDLPASVGAELAANIQANADNAIFLRCLAERNKQRRQVSEKPNASNYGPKHFEKMPEAKGLSKARLERAMDRLFRINAIERGVVYRDTAEGHDVYGLVEIGRKIPEGSPEGSRKVQPEGSGNPQESTGNSVPIYTYIPGAAPEAAAPFTEDEEVDPAFAANDVADVLRRLTTPLDDETDF